MSKHKYQTSMCLRDSILVSIAARVSDLGDGMVSLFSIELRT